MNQLQIFDDISRGRDNGESREAFERLKPILPSIRHDVLCVAVARGTITLKRAMTSLHMPAHTISGRLTELKALHLLEETEERDAGCRVLRPTAAGVKAVLAERQTVRS